MKKIRYFCWLLILAAVIQLCVPAVQATGEDAQPDYSTDSSVIEGCHSIDAQKPLLGSGKLLESAQAAFLYEVSTDTVLYAWNPDKELPPSGLVKMVTCILALENGNLDDEVMVSGNALAAVPEYYHGDIGLVAGEVFTLRELLYLTMVSGSNDASAVVAEHIGGSQQAFVNMMNQWAAEVGCTNTTFVDAHGIKQTGQVTTARDMARILRECMKNEDFMVFFSTLRYEVPATSYYGIRYAVATHPMMTSGVSNIYYNKRITGARTGVSQERWRSIATTSQSGDLTYISIVLCAIPTFHEDDYTIIRYGSYEETLDLMQMAYSGMRRAQVLDKDQITTQYPVLDGLNHIVAGPTTSAYTVLPSDVLLSNLEVRYIHNYASLDSPVEAGDKITTMQMWYNDVCLAQSDVAAKNSVYAFNSDAAIQIQEPTRSNWTMLFLILGGVVAVVVLFIGGSRLRSRLRYTRRSRRRNSGAASRRRRR